MKPISIEEIVTYKSLPFDIYNESGELLFEQGEQLDSDRIAFLCNLPVIMRNIPITDEITSNKTEFSEHVEHLKNKINQKHVIEKSDFMPSEELFPRSLIDYVNLNNYNGPVNKISKIEVNTQIKMKVVTISAIDFFKENNINECFELLTELKNKINDIIELKMPVVKKCSELIFLGEYEYCHILNTAILATVLARKLNFSSDQVLDITMAGLIHDIGKYRIGKNVDTTMHTKIGYEIAKNEFKFPHFICKAVLEHHEHNNGTGYPNKLSGNQISIASNIISLCSFFDNLLFNRTKYRVKTPHEAFRILLSFGTDMFLPNVFYSFLHLFSYNDVVSLEEIMFE